MISDILCKYKDIATIVVHRVDSFINPLRCLLDGYLATLGVNLREELTTKRS